MGDPRLMSMQQRYETWADHASVLLLETAAVHQTAVTYADLAARVQERSGVSTEVPTSTRSVRASTHGIQASAFGACPPASRQGWK